MNESVDDPGHNEAILKLSKDEKELIITNKLPLYTHLHDRGYNKGQFETQAYI